MPAATRRDSVDISSRKCFHAKTLQTYRKRNMSTVSCLLAVVYAILIALNEHSFSADVGGDGMYFAREAPHDGFPGRWQSEACW
jgi:hypothetical protein